MRKELLGEYIFVKEIKHDFQEARLITFCYHTLVADMLLQHNQILLVLFYKEIAIFYNVNKF
ncbi:hypothetical protein BpHYR1_031421 [Brachionus plicatilis]|uniref:Uncharacterized protein n=1 Tax=Brachionus plicatilis TaxID=10195 RepID=A0A3M7RH81_BRAPC|nr:hypothetical protein BpHYR1_031421 [Brachionus plicatilis]